MNLLIRFLMVTQQSNIHRVHNQGFGIFHRVIGFGTGVFRRCDIEMAVLSLFPLILRISYPTGTGMVKWISHVIISIICENSMSTDFDNWRTYTAGKFHYTGCTVHRDNRRDTRLQESASSKHLLEMRLCDADRIGKHSLQL